VAPFRHLAIVSSGLELLETHQAIGDAFREKRQNVDLRVKVPMQDQH